MLVFGVFLRVSQRIQRRKAELTLAQIREMLPNGWADWHKIWHTCANSYGNGYTPNKLPLDSQGGTWQVLGGQQFKSLGKLSDCPQLWFTSADSSGNGHRLNTSRPSIPQGALGGGGVSVSQIKKSWEAVKRLDRLAPHWAHIWGAFRGGGGVRGSHIQKSEVAPIGIKFRIRRWIRLAMDIG